MVTEQETPVRRRRRERSARQAAAPSGPEPVWPGDPERAEAGDIDFEAVAHVLANTCRWNGRTRRFLSVAQHGLIVSEEIEDLDGIPDEERRALGLYALLADAGTAWLGGEDGPDTVSARAAARTRAHGARVDRAVREAAGLEAEPPAERAELLRFVARMADAAERRDLGVGGGGSPFPPLGRTVRPLAPEAAAERWLERFRTLVGRPVPGAAAPAGAAAAGGDVAAGGVASGEPEKGQ